MADAAEVFAVAAGRTGRRSYTSWPSTAGAISERWTQGPRHIRWSPPPARRIATPTPARASRRPGGPRVSRWRFSRHGFLRRDLHRLHLPLRRGDRPGPPARGGPGLQGYGHHATSAWPTPWDHAHGAGDRQPRLRAGRGAGSDLLPAPAQRPRPGAGYRQRAIDLGITRFDAPSAATAAARSPPGRPATSPPRSSSATCTPPATRPASTKRGSPGPWPAPAIRHPGPGPFQRFFTLKTGDPTPNPVNEDRSNGKPQRPRRSKRGQTEDCQAHAARSRRRPCGGSLRLPDFFALRCLSLPLIFPTRGTKALPLSTPPRPSLFRSSSGPR